ncbi:MAG: energy transducer TonB [Bacteroidales bacterium]|nr:energy transducer TonB [Bacteroidales bacterium]
MNNGKDTCNKLKAIRKQIADANEIDYEPTECQHEGPCRGTCPKCESEMRYIERELQNRASLGKKVAIVGLATGLSSLWVANASAQCVNNDTIPENTIEDIHGDIELPLELEGEVEDDPVYIVPDEMPQFPGGVEAMRRYIAENIKYPAIAGEVDLHGRVWLTFIIDQKGTISDITVIRSLDPHLDAEAIRVVKSMPKWEPGLIKGRPVKVKYTLPVHFDISL